MLRAIREGEEESLEACATKLGVSRTNLHDIESGRRGVSVERAAQWAKLLGYMPEQFVQLALQALVDAAGLKLSVDVTKRARDRAGRRVQPTTFAVPVPDAGTYARRA
jgi:transcriptional regulator with XRE-family HTH domain